MTGYEPYKGTMVPIERSKEAIRKILEENGAVTTIFTDSSQFGIIEIKWARKVILEENKQRHEMIQPCRIRVLVGKRDPRQIYRALFYHLKTKFEIIRFGILTFEEEFLPFFLVQLPDGRQVTVAEMALPSIQHGQAPDFKALMLPERTGSQ